MTVTRIELEQYPAKLNLSFAGCGFLGIYHVGVSSCIKEYAPHVLFNKIAGASVGSLAACALICGIPLGEVTTDILRVAVKARSRALGPFHPGFDLNRIVYNDLCKMLPYDAHIQCNGRLHVSVTRVSDGQNVLLSHFDSRDDLIQALMCSCFIPFYSGLLPPKFHGVGYMDGGFSDNLPVLDENTVTVSPFAGESDICPQDNSFSILQVDLANTSIAITPANLYRFARILFPPHPEILSKMCQQGFDDTLKFLQRNNLISCTRCLAVQSSFVVAESASLEENEPETDTFKDHDHHHDDCIDCRYRRQMALLDSLPETVVSAIQDACDQVNKGVINWLFRHRPMKLLSVISIPYVLPVDITIVVFCKLLELLPEIKKEMKSLIHSLISVAKSLLHKLNKQRHQYSAKFSCQLEITEFNYTEQNIMLSHSPRKISPLHAHQYSAEKTKKSLDANFVPKRLKRMSYAGASQTPLRLPERRKSMVDNRDPERIIKNMKFGFTLDLSPTHSSSENKKRDVVEALKTLGEEEDESQFRNIMDITNKALNWERECIGQYQTNIEPQNTETFEKMLDVTASNEALMSFYYTDENNRVKVTEIYNVSDADSSAVLSQEEMEVNSKLQWDSEWSSPVMMKDTVLEGSFLSPAEDKSFLSATDESCDNFPELLDYRKDKNKVPKRKTSVMMMPTYKHE